MYAFPLDGKFEENIRAPSESKVFKLKKSNTDTFLTGFNEYYKKSLLEQVGNIRNRFWLFMNAKGETLREPDMPPAEEYIKGLGLSLDPAIVKLKKVNAYMPLLIQAFMIDELIKLGVDEKHLRDIATIRSWGKEMPAAVLKQTVGFPIGFTMKT